MAGCGWQEMVGVMARNKKPGVVGSGCGVCWKEVGD